MLSKILGTLSVLGGLLWLVKPEALKNRLTRKMDRTLRRVIFLFIVVFGFLIIVSVIKSPGLLSKAVGVIGLVITVKGIQLITSKASGKMSEWLSGKSMLFFRIWAAAICVFGIMLILS
ncbi:MAG: hypothetical protein JW994_02220 [Candidatus Omnitrophica bacterium]|nr:hypothetical protein [Candidatus Omnitrophota bacterium]